MRKGSIVTCDRRHFIVDNVKKFEEFKRKQNKNLLLDVQDERELADRMAKESKGIGLVLCDQDGRRIKNSSRRKNPRV